AIELYEKRLVLVRPDGHVAWRGDASPLDAAAVIDRVRGAVPSGLFRRRAASRLLMGARRVVSLRYRTSDAIGAKRTWRRCREGADLSKMTHSRQRLLRNPAVQ